MNILIKLMSIVALVIAPHINMNKKVDKKGMQQKDSLKKTVQVEKNHQKNYDKFTF